VATRRKGVLAAAGVALLALAVAGLLAWPRAPRELPTTGIVVFESGAPCEYARVTWRQANGPETGSAQRGRGGNGRFWAGYTPVGRVLLRAQIPGGVSSPEVAVQAGERNVRIVVPDGAVLALRFQPWGPEYDGPAYVRAADGNEASWWITARVDGSGRARILGLRPGIPHEVFVQSGEPCRATWSKGLIAGADEAAVRLVAAKPITGRLVFPGRAEFSSARIVVGGDDWIAVHGEVLGDRFTIPCVPPGVWRVVASVTVSEDEDWEGTADAEAGAEDVEIRLVRSKD
jgi:hypothetical protein